MAATKYGGGAIGLLYLLIYLVHRSVGIPTISNITAAVKPVHHAKPHISPLLKVTQPLMNISRFYCSKGLPLDDWTHSTFFIDKLMAADDNTHNSDGLHMLANALKKCAKFYRGDEDWAGPNIPLDDEDYDDYDESTTTEPPPNVLYNLISSGADKATEYAKVSFDYAKDLSISALKAMKIMKRRKRDIAVNQEALKIVRLLYEVSKRACQPYGLYNIVDKYFLKIVELMELAVRVEMKEDHVQPFILVRETLEECLTYPHGELWEMSAEFLEH